MNILNADRLKIGDVVKMTQNSWGGFKEGTICTIKYMSKDANIYRLLSLSKSRLMNHPLGDFTLLITGNKDEQIKF